jgi:hypothetical protein
MFSRPNPFATSATSATTNPFASPTKPAAANPFAATFGKPAGATTTSPFQNKGIFSTSAGVGAQPVQQVVQQPPIPQDPQQQVFFAADTVISHYVHVSLGDGSLKRLRDVLKPYSKAVIPEYAFRVSFVRVLDNAHYWLLINTCAESSVQRQRPFCTQTRAHHNRRMGA